MGVVAGLCACKRLYELKSLTKGRLGSNLLLLSHRVAYTCTFCCTQSEVYGTMFNALCGY